MSSASIRSPPLRTLQKKAQRAAPSSKPGQGLCNTHDAIEVESILSMGVPCSRVMTYEMMETQPHYVARHTIKESGCR